MAEMFVITGFMYEMWNPLYNISLNSRIHEKGYLKEMLRKRLRVFHNGHVRWPSPITAVTSCSLDMTSFPWDEQTCSWHLGSWIYPQHEVDLTPQPDPDNFTIHYVEHGEWELQETFSSALITSEGIDPEEIWPKVSFSVRLKRKPLFFLVNLILPSLIITALSLLSFCVPTEEGEKITVSITVLLAITVFLLVVNDILPVQSYKVPVICKYRRDIVFNEL